MFIHIYYVFNIYICLDLFLFTNVNKLSTFFSIIRRFSGELYMTHVHYNIVYQQQYCNNIMII